MHMIWFEKCTPITKGIEELGVDHYQWSLDAPAATALVLHAAKYMGVADMVRPEFFAAKTNC